MITTTRLNNHPFFVNSDLIKFIDQAPDTVITLVTGEKIIVLETPEQVIERIVAFRRRLLQGLDLTAPWVAPAIIERPETTEENN